LIRSDPCRESREGSPRRADCSAAEPKVVSVTARWATIPKRPAVYAMYGGWPPRLWVAYVGIAGNLSGRLDQHFVRRDSSVTTGVGAVGVNPDYIRVVRWWEHETLDDSDHRHAAELIAFEVLDPALRSRGGVREAARILAHEPGFADTMRALFNGAPSDEFRLPWLWDTDTRVEQLERRVAELERRLEDAG
jgi:hypothetical protein